MAPEQAQAAGEVDGRADQFALAAIVYEMLTARMAFPGDRVEIVVYRISHEEPKPLGPAWGPGLASVIMRALAKDPARRFATTDEFAAALRVAVESDRLLRTTTGSSTRATQRHPSQDALPPLGPETRERHAATSHRWTVVGGISVGLALAGVLAVPLMRRPIRHEGTAATAVSAPVNEPATATAIRAATVPAAVPEKSAAATDEPPAAPTEAHAVVAHPTAVASVPPARPERRNAARARAVITKKSTAAAVTTAPLAPTEGLPASGPDGGTAAVNGKAAGTSTRGSKLGSLIDRL
jgi:serine/threonine-protein kinase